MIGYIVLVALWAAAVLLLGGYVIWSHMRDERREIREFNHLLDADWTTKW